jgi:hypothetical protein
MIATVMSTYGENLEELNLDILCVFNKVTSLWQQLLQTSLLINGEYNILLHIPVTVRAKA